MSFTGKQKKNTYKDITYIGGGNSGVTSSPKSLFTGEGSSTSLIISDRACHVKSATDNTTAFEVRNSSNDSKLLVDTTNNYVKGNGVHVHTQYKEFGLFDFSPTQGYHNPMVCNNMMFSDSGADIIADDSMFSNGADPATTLDLSANGTASTATACYWFIEDDIYIDAIRVVATCNSSQALNFHVYSYDLDTSSNHGDLSNGTLIAHIGSSMTPSGTSIKTDTLAVDSASIAADKIILAFAENEGGTGDITAQLNIKYHITG